MFKTFLVQGDFRLDLYQILCVVSLKGNFSETDDDNWTSELEHLLNYDRRKAVKNDNGEFFF